ncbi:hypothetical protein PoB_007073000, partial [Plakobranchus ocellatus]
MVWFISSSTIRSMCFQVRANVATPATTGPHLRTICGTLISPQMAVVMLYT